ncbi:protein trapped in endoderm-1-like [Mizuhopecten yessoensis]|uniref:protein trapped in endoderm-1-like n=1 Tax=Mizuhopecten yessoensis TaxID=6573 RepID=UPI000B45F439|nr:protein trapped in endoderm-1-like [Mizuhopecten yessoensis]
MQEPLKVNQTDHVFMSTETQLLHNVAATTIASLGFITNASTILAIIKTRLYREAAILLVLNLIMLNLIPCVFSLPYISYLSFTHQERVAGKVDDTLCKIMGFLTYSMVGSEILGLILICTNRYILVVHFDKYQQIYKRKFNVVVMLVVSWSIYPILLIFPASEVWGQLKYDPQRFFCHPFNGDSYSSFLTLLTVGVSMPILAFCYIAMIYKVWTSKFKVDASRSIHQSTYQPNKPGTRRYKQERQLVITVILILTTFTLLYTPFILLSILDQDDSKYDPIIIIACLYTAWSHTVINPLVYSFRNSHILKAFCCRTSNS